MNLRRIVQALTAFLLVAAGCVIAPFPVAAETPELPIDVDLVHGFSIKDASIKTGTTVVWRNVEQVAHEAFYHTVSADDASFESGNLIPGARFSHTFNEPGSFSYKCALHAQVMMASLTVTGPKIEPPALEKTVRIVEPSADSSSWTYEPQDLIGTVGVKVTWRNDGAAPHTVTTEDGSIDSGELDSGESWTVSFKRPASMRYICSLHPWMKGTVRIASAGGAPPPPPPPAREPPKTSTGDFSSGNTARADDKPVTFKVGMVEPSISDVNSWTFEPNTLRARVGDTVIWRNAGQAPHTATAADKSFDSGNVAPGATYALKLRTQGSFAYLCTLHPWMKGSVIVAAAGSPADGGGVPVNIAPPTAGDEPVNRPVENESPRAPTERRALALAVLLASVLITVALVGSMRRPKRPPQPESALDHAEPVIPDEVDDRDLVAV